MALIPLGNTVFGRVIKSPAKQHSGILRPFEERQKFMTEVVAIGPECKELEVGDIAILNEFGGSMVTITDPETHEQTRVFVIREDAVLAKWTSDSVPEVVA